MTARAAAIADFLARNGYDVERAVPLAQDASFRRYLRLPGGKSPALLMDAPAPEDVRPFLAIARHLAGIGVSVPAILAADPGSGLIIEEDFGDALFGALIDAGADPAPLIDAAVDALVLMQRAAPPPGLPSWDARAMIAAARDPLLAWWWPDAFGASPPPDAASGLEAALASMLAPLAALPPCFVHRDYFAGNLILLADRMGPARAGVIDFQSAALGAPAYDLVSLVQDSRRDLPAGLQERAIARLLEARPELNPALFRRGFAACAALRHLRIAAQWLRLARRDQRPAYLAHGPRSWRQLHEALADPVAAPLAAWLDRWIPPERRATPPPPRPVAVPPAPRTAMVLAAGLGTRMRPLTADTAKPLLPLGGRGLLDHALDRLAAAGVARAVVNAHWQADRVAEALAARASPPATELRREAMLLDTGGGVRAALDRLGPDPFYIVNGDAFWLDGPTPALRRLAEAFARRDALAALLLHRTCQVGAEVGPGDFLLDPWGTPRRRGEREIAPYVFAGVQLIAPSLLADMPEGTFSMNRAWDAALAAGRLCAVVHDGLWFHLSTPADLAEAEAVLHERRTGESR